MNTFKQFWINFNFRKWTFEGRKLANPISIIRKIMVFPFLYLAVILYCILVALFEFSIDAGIEVYCNNF